MSVKNRVDYTVDFVDNYIGVVDQYEQPVVHTLEMVQVHIVDLVEFWDQTVELLS
jgi:hypothetical protein